MNQPPLIRIYVASSWRNNFQPQIVEGLRAIPGSVVYDFKQPVPGDNGFHWSEIDPDWKNVTVKRFIEILDHEIAEAGFNKDMTALRECDACALVMPCGRSAHLELGWAAGAGKHTAVYFPPEVQVEPELMYKMCDLITDDFDSMRNWLESMS